MEKLFENMEDKDYFKWGSSLSGAGSVFAGGYIVSNLYNDIEFHHTKKRLERLEPKNYYLYRVYNEDEFVEYFDYEFKEEGKRQISPEEYFEDFHFVDLRYRFPDIHSEKLKEYKEKYGKEPDVLSEDF